MNQAAFLRDFDAAAVGAFLGAGMADDAVYTAPGGGAGVACRVLVDRDVEDFGDDAAPVSLRRTRITFQRAEVEPVAMAQVVIGAETFTLAKRVRFDESLSVWWVQHG